MDKQQKQGGKDRQKVTAEETAEETASGRAGETAEPCKQRSKDNSDTTTHRHTPLTTNRLPATSRRASAPNAPSSCSTWASPIPSPGSATARPRPPASTATPRSRSPRTSASGTTATTRASPAPTSASCGPTRACPSTGISGGMAVPAGSEFSAGAGLGLGACLLTWRVQESAGRYGAVGSPHSRHPGAVPQVCYRHAEGGEQARRHPRRGPRAHPACIRHAVGGQDAAGRTGLPARGWWGGNAQVSLYTCGRSWEVAC